MGRANLQLLLQLQYQHLLVGDGLLTVTQLQLSGLAAAAQHERRCMSRQEQHPSKTDDTRMDALGNDDNPAFICMPPIHCRRHSPRWTDRPFPPHLPPTLLRLTSSCPSISLIVRFDFVNELSNCRTRRMTTSWTPLTPSAPSAPRQKPPHQVNGEGHVHTAVHRSRSMTAHQQATTITTQQRPSIPSNDHQYPATPYQSALRGCWRFRWTARLPLRPRR